MNNKNYFWFLILGFLAESGEWLSSTPQVRKTVWILRLYLWCGTGRSIYWKATALLPKNFYAKPSQDSSLMTRKKGGRMFRTGTNLPLSSRCGRTSPLNLHLNLHIYARTPLEYQAWRHPQNFVRRFTSYYSCAYVVLLRRLSLYAANRRRRNLVER
jgi:hypothetical protein